MAAKLFDGLGVFEGLEDSFNRGRSQQPKGRTAENDPQAPGIWDIGIIEDSSMNPGFLKCLISRSSAWDDLVKTRTAN